MIDYVGTMSLDESGITILPRYYKHVADFQYKYGGFAGEEVDLVPLEYVICIVALTFHEEVGLYIISKEDQVLLNNFIPKAHGKSSTKKHISTSDLLSSQEQGTQSIMEYNTRSGRCATPFVAS